MSATAAEFTFAFSDEPPVLSAARQLAGTLAAGDAISRRSLNKALELAFGGTDADAHWSTSDVHAALELAQVIWLRDSCGLTTASSGTDASTAFDRLEANLVPQHNRSQSQIALQQFSTPPRLAWLAARACAIIPSEVLLEPSAGTGMLAVWAHLAGARLALNEVAPPRRDCLASLFPTAAVSGHDAELIDELLDPRLIPSVVLMNPPYSFGLERGADGRTGSRHLRAAFRRLAPGGRLVVIMPEWFDAGRFARKLAAPHALRLNLTIERAFARHGTSITTRLNVTIPPISTPMRAPADLAAPGSGWRKWRPSSMRCLLSSIASAGCRPERRFIGDARRLDGTVQMNIKMPYRSCERIARWLRYWLNRAMTRRF